MKDTGVSPRSSPIYETFEERISGLFEGLKIRTCIQCGTCAASCPFGIGMDFTPRKIIAALRADMIEDVINGHGIWLCTACFTCTDRCPSGIPLTDALITGMKEACLLHGKGPPLELQKALQNTARYGNPFGESPRKRAEWVNEASAPVVDLTRDSKPVDVLLVTECYAAYHQRAKNVSISLVKIFDKLGINFGILGHEEKCIGDANRLAGEFGLFETLIEQNSKVLYKYDFKIIVTPDPHAYNALKNEYPKFGHFFNVYHYTQFLSEKLDELKPLLKKELNYTVTFHDPCYLGRRNGMFDEPRKILGAIPGLRFVEMPRNRSDSLCCGGGGGGVWLDSFIKEHIAVRPAEKRVKEAASTGAQVLAVACPIDLTMFEDAVKLLSLEEKLVIKDISELIVEAME